MAMLKTFDLKGNKQSFANWISNLSPTETPFISMISKQKVDQVQYSWQTDRLSQPAMQGATPTPPNGGASDPDSTDIVLPADDGKEGSEFKSHNLYHTTVHTNFTKIFRKAVRITDTAEKISLYGRNSELSYQMEKAGLEIKRDLEHMVLNSTVDGHPGSSLEASSFMGFRLLVAPKDAPDPDTGAVVHKVVKYAAPAAGKNPIWFTKAQVFDLTYNLYMAGSMANKIMFHPQVMGIFSDWVGQSEAATPHLHRMFDGLDAKYNMNIKRIRDPLGQVYDLIPNRHMPKNMLFFFDPSDWTQMVLREPEKIVLGKIGSSEKHMIEMEVGLRHRNPFASGVLEFIQDGKDFIQEVRVTPFTTTADNTAQATVTVISKADTGGQGTKVITVTAENTDGDGSSDGVGAAVTVTSGGATSNGLTTATLKTTKAGRSKVKVAFTTASDGNEEYVAADFHEQRD